MSPYLNLVLAECGCGFGAFCCLYVGLRGIVARKPFLISSRWFFASLLAVAAPIILQMLLGQAPRPGAEPVALAPINWLAPGIFIVILVLAWRDSRDYMVFGVTDSSLREGLMAALKKLDLPYEATASTIRLPSVGANLQVTVNDSLGVGDLKIKPRRFSRLLGEVARGTNEYYRTSIVQAKWTWSILFLLFGVSMLVTMLVTMLTSSLFSASRQWGSS